MIVDPVLPPKEQEQQTSTPNIEIQSTEREESNGTEKDEGSEEGIDEMIGATRWQKAARKKQLEALKAQKEDGAQKPISNIEHLLDSGDNSKKSEAQKQEEKLSRAERRRRIKEQILADGEGESFKGYRRRMW